MSSRTRGIVAVVVAAVVFFALAWVDAAVLARGRDQALATFSMGSYLWVAALGTLAVAGSAILFAGLAWWSRSFVASVVFLLAGAAEMLVQPLVFTFAGDWLLGLNIALSWWIINTDGPLNAALFLGAALIVAGLIGLYRWATTRRLAVVDR
jgi:hypothetical protein